VKAVEVYKKFTTQIEEKIEKLLGTKPDSGMDFKSFAPLKSRR